MKLVGNIAKRYLRISARSKAVTAMTIISLLGIIIGVATLTASLSVADGFSRQYQKSIVDFSAHVVLLSTGEIDGANEVVRRLEGMKEDGVTSVNPFVYREGLLVFNGAIRGVILKGVHPAGLHTLKGIKANIEEEFVQGSDSIIIGKALSDELKISAGDEVRVMLPTSFDEARGGNFKIFKVIGTFEAGMHDFDSQFALIDLSNAQRLFEIPDTVSGIEIMLDDWKEAPTFALKLEKEFSYPLYASHWQELNRSLFDAVKLEKIMFIIIMGALVVVAAFNIIGTVMLKILYKTSDVSVLRALGMKRGDLRRIFVWQGFIVGAIGTFVGVVLAVVLLWSVEAFELIKIPPEIYLLKTLPICISWKACVMIAAFSLTVCWLTSAIASKKALELPILKGLHGG